MKRKLREVIDLLEYEELIRIKDDINKGGDGIKILVDNKIKDEIKKKNEFCAVCAAKVEPESSTKFTLTFGPEELKRTVSFCAIDCLEYFLNEIKKVKLK
jgi:hypothetical protein